MTHQPSPTAFAGADAGRKLAQLRRILELVEEIAGEASPRRVSDRALDEAARFSSAYADALPIVQRRFDALASEISAWATAGVEALVAAGNAAPPAAAARRLARELSEALARLSALVRA